MSAMDGHSKDREETLFAAALQLPPGERAAFLNQQCGSDAGLRRSVEELLAAEGDAGDLLNLPPTRRVDLPMPRPAESTRSTEKPGDRIGHYQLLEEIGAGGCGVVYLAEQEKPVRRQVALKVIKLGMDTRQVVARFEFERQALASMDHPNIAQVFDAGQTAAGRSFFVMELVRGERITRYCDLKRLPTHARLELFLQACSAIEHAHQKGIIHRDLKPSNVLVGEVNGAPLLKVIDFGIAKATGPLPLTDGTQFTGLGQFIGTPAYMSPEQAGMGMADVDTRSDIYSLGVLLYELLTGTTPLDSQTLNDMGIEELRRAVCEQESPSPSSRLTTLGQDRLADVAGRHGTEARGLVRSLRGDLDWIALKALEKDRTRRYESVGALAADIRRYLGNQPVLARPPSAAYLFRKLVRRHRLAFAAGAVIATSLILGLAVSTRLYFEEQTARLLAEHSKARMEAALRSAEIQRDAATKAEANALASKGLAEKEARNASNVTDFLQKDIMRQVYLLEQVASGRAADTREPLFEMLTLAGEQVGKQFEGRPAMEAEIEFTIGRSFVILQEPARGIPHLERALALKKEILGASHPETVGLMCTTGHAYRQTRQYKEAVRYYQEAIDIMKTHWAHDHDGLLVEMGNMALVHMDAGEFARAAEILADSIKRRQTRPEYDRESILYPLRSLVVCYQQMNRPEALVPPLEELFFITKSLRGDQHRETIELANYLGDNYAKIGRHDAARLLYEAILKFDRNVNGTNAIAIVPLMNKLAVTSENAGRPDRTLELYREVFQISRAKFGSLHQETYAAWGGLADALLRNGPQTETESLLMERFQELNSPQVNLSPGSPLRVQFTDCLRKLVQFHTLGKRPEEAAQWQAKLDALNQRQN